MVNPLQARAADKVQPRNSTQFCIFLFLMGGPPQLDTFDVKEGKWTPPDFDIRTLTPEIRIPVSLFSKLSEQERLNHMLFVRSVEAWEDVHERGQYHIQGDGPGGPWNASCHICSAVVPSSIVGRIGVKI